MKARIPSFDYRLKRERLDIRDVSLDLECLEDLDQTIDQLFEHLAKGGNPSLLEELCPYFGVVWPSARALSELLVDEFRQKLVGAKVLEVGCGLAIPSMIAHKLGADVTAADFHPEVPHFLARNLANNHISNIRYVALDWTQPGDGAEKYEFVIGSDILYEKAHPAAVARAVASLLTPTGTALIADPARPYLQEFSDQMRAAGFSVKTEVRHAATKDIFLLTFKKQQQM